MHVHLVVKLEGVKHSICFILYDINPQAYLKEKRQVSWIHQAWFVPYYISVHIFTPYLYHITPQDKYKIAPLQIRFPTCLCFQSWVLIFCF